MKLFSCYLFVVLVNKDHLKHYEVYNLLSHSYNAMGVFFLPDFVFESCLSCPQLDH